MVYIDFTDSDVFLAGQLVSNDEKEVVLSRVISKGMKYESANIPKDKTLQMREMKPLEISNWMEKLKTCNLENNSYH